MRFTQNVVVYLRLMHEHRRVKHAYWLDVYIFARGPSGPRAHLECRVDMLSNTAYMYKLFITSLRE